MANFTEKENAGCCRHCGSPLRGRSDKLYCGDSCRNAYNNARLSREHTEIRTVELTLKKNRRILQNLLGEKRVHSLPRATLVQRGFVFKYHTHNYTSGKGDQYTFCYDYGYTAAAHDRLLIVKALDGSPPEKVS